MSSFAVLHISRYKELTKIGQHIDRRHVAANVRREKSGFNEDLRNILGLGIDPSKTALKEDWVKPVGERLEDAVAARIAAGYKSKRAIRSDAVKALGIILTGSHERMKAIERDEALFAKWKQANYDFACKEFSQENIVRFTLHRDERTPHFHCVVVPLTKDGRLSAKEIASSAEKMKAYQDRYAVLMQEFGLARGIPKTLTQLSHITTKEYYQSVNELAQEAKEVCAEIKPSNVLQLAALRERLAEHVTQLAVESSEKDIQVQRFAQAYFKSEEAAGKQVFQKVNEESLKRSYDWIKSSIPLADFAVAKLGWKVVKDKSTKRDLVLRRDADGRKILCPTAKKAPDGHYVFSWLNEQPQKKGGTLIDLLLLEGWSWQAITKLAHQEIMPPVDELIKAKGLSPKAPFLIEDPNEQTSMAMEHFRGTAHAVDKPTYLDQRGIQAATYGDLEQVKANEKAALFALYSNFDAEGNMRMCSTINYVLDKHGHRKKYLQKGLPRSFAVLEARQEIQRIVLTESPIDALSHRQMALQAAQGNGDEEAFAKVQGTRYMSTCGSIGKTMSRDLEVVLARAKELQQEVIISFDRDAAGKRMAAHVEELAKQAGCRHEVHFPPKGKDWNDYLVNQQDWHQEEAMARHRLAHFEAISYRESLLMRMGFEEQGMQELAGYQAAKQEVLFPCYADWSSLEEKRLCGTYQVSLEADKTLIRTQTPVQGEGMVLLEGRKPMETLVLTQDPMEALAYRQALFSQYKDMLEEHRLASNAHYSAEVAYQEQEWRGQVEERVQEVYEATLSVKEKVTAKKEAFSEKLATTWYLSTCGEVTPKQMASLKHILYQMKQSDKQLSLCMEGPEAAHLKKVFEQQQLLPKLEFASKKGWQASSGVSSLDRVDRLLQALTSNQVEDDDTWQEEEQRRRKLRRYRGRGRRI